MSTGRQVDRSTGRRLSLFGCLELGEQRGSVAMGEIIAVGVSIEQGDESLGSKSRPCSRTSLYESAISDRSVGRPARAARAASTVRVGIVVDERDVLVQESSFSQPHLHEARKPKLIDDEVVDCRQEVSDPVKIGRGFSGRNDGRGGILIRAHASADRQPSPKPRIGFMSQLPAASSEGGLSTIQPAHPNRGSS